jgi:hypothetical protein
MGELRNKCVANLPDSWINVTVGSKHFMKYFSFLLKLFHYNKKKKNEKLGYRVVRMDNQ